MKKLILTIGLILILCLAASEVGYTQFRTDVTTPYTRTGKIVKENTQGGTNLFGNWSMQMSHSYSMSFSNFGGNTQNINMYTNSMDFYFSDKLTGDLDISFMHSPFGSNLSPLEGSSGFNGKIFVNNASLNYEINDKTSISIHFQQVPYNRAFGFNRFGYGYGRNQMGINNVFIN